MQRRAGVRRLAVLASRSPGEDVLRLELDSVLSPNTFGVTLGTGVWTPGEFGEDVIGRAMAAGGTTQVGANPMTPTDLV